MPYVRKGRSEHPHRAMVRDMFAQGLCPKEVAWELGISSLSLYRLCKRMGQPLPPRRRPWYHDKAMELYQQGVTPKEISRVLKLHPHTINKIRQKLGVPARYGAGGVTRWSGAQLEKMKQLYLLHGLSFRQIATQISYDDGRPITRCVVAGLCHRHGWVRGKPSGHRGGNGSI